MLLRTKYTIVFMWFNGPFRHQVFLKSDVEEEILPPWANQQNPKKTLTNMSAYLRNCMHSLRLPAMTRHL